ncbi:MAG: hypothetical protein LIO69_02215 [Oscillospiraceae bacterium]|nr:hypothetical protein [Oscillospiraceae bacterium]
MNKNKEKSKDSAEPKSKRRKESDNRAENAEIIDMLDSAFNEDLSELSELSGLDEEQNDTAKGKAENKNHFIIGLFVMVMSAIGIICTVGYIIGFVGDIVNNTKQKNEFAEFIYPVVICDPAPFDASQRMKNETVISAAIWDIILYEDQSKYETEFDYIIVPEVEIEQHAVKLFGAGLTIEHTTIASIDLSFYYDEESSSYRIPSNPKYFSYSPTVTEITKSGNVYTLTVGYISPTPSWLAQTSSETPEPEKYVEYTLTESGDSYIITAIRQYETVIDEDF